MDPSLQVSRTANRFLEEFSDEFKSALVLSSDIELWAKEYGFSRDSDALTTTWPINVDAVGYHEFKGEHKYRHMYHRVARMRTKTWQDGVEITREELEAPEFTGWADQPELMATEWMRLSNQLVAAMLESGGGTGPVLDFYRDPDTNVAGTRTLFAADHPYNVLNTALGSFQNDISIPIANIQNGTAWKTISDYFRSIKAPNGQPMGLRYREGGYNIIPATRETLFEESLKQDTLIRAINASGQVNQASGNVAAVLQKNLYTKIGYTVADELVNQNVFFALAAPKPGLHAWVVQQESAPEEITFDTNSEEFRKTRKVKKSLVGKANAAALLPHRILRVTIT